MLFLETRAPARNTCGEYIILVLKNIEAIVCKNDTVISRTLQIGPFDSIM